MTFLSWTLLFGSKRYLFYFSLFISEEIGKQKQILHINIDIDNINISINIKIYIMNQFPEMI